ncbi:hypothetical protein [Polluticaenibacter yanchengensis]|uniref:Lipocalin-like domain-containing protein n=1 Tax=Polluticaenibacter yanchengensis TaxID=3014562 RepID=A0ABT4UGE3_9BACT|nr:hypothetical protein [Chitinophagaceae bacterium LY-5]
MIKKIFVPLLLVLSVISISGCKKVKDKIVESLLMKLITDNAWVVSNFNEAGTDITADFSAYSFEFYDNGRVFAIKNGVQEFMGTWSPNESSKTITSNFPTATEPVKKFNGVWYITNTGLNPNFVEAKLTTEEGKVLRLKLNSK